MATRRKGTPIRFPIWSILLSILVILGVSMSPRPSLHRDGFQTNSTWIGTGKQRRLEGGVTLSKEIQTDQQALAVYPTSKALYANDPTPGIVLSLRVKDMSYTTPTTDSKGASMNTLNTLQYSMLDLPQLDSTITHIEYDSMIVLGNGQLLKRFLTVYDVAAKSLVLYYPKDSERFSFVPEQLAKAGYVTPDSNNSTSQKLSIGTMPSMPNPDPLPKEIRRVTILGDVSLLKQQPVTPDSPFWKTEEERQRILKLLETDTIAKSGSISGGELASSIGSGIASGWSSISGVWNGITSRPEVLYPVLGAFAVLLGIIFTARALGR